MAERIAQFEAIIAEMPSALKVSNEGAGRLTLDMDESQLPQVLRAIAFGKDQLLTVTIEVNQ